MNLPRILINNTIKILFFSSLSLFLMAQGIHNASASPIFSTQTIYHPATINFPDEPAPSDKLYLAIDKVIYSSDGKFLNATFILYGSFDNTTTQSVSYGMLIDTDDNYKTGIGGFDYRYKVTWENHIWRETYEHLLANEIPPVVTYSHELPELFTHSEKFINLSVDLTKIKTPENYNILYFVDAENPDGTSMQDITSLAIIPPPNFVVQTIPNPILLKPRDHTIAFIRVQSEMKGQPQIFFNLNRPLDDPLYVSSLLSDNSFFLSGGVADIPIDISVPADVTPSYHKLSVVLTPFYPINPNKNSTEINDLLIRNAYYRNDIFQETFDTGIAVSTADQLPIEFFPQIALVLATFGIVGVTWFWNWRTHRTTRESNVQFRESANQLRDSTNQLRLSNDLLETEIESTFRPIIGRHAYEMKKYHRSQINDDTCSITPEKIMFHIINNGKSPAIQVSYKYYVGVRNTPSQERKLQPTGSIGSIPISSLAPSEYYSIDIPFQARMFNIAKNNVRCYFGFIIWYSGENRRRYYYHMEGFFNKGALMLNHVDMGTFS